MEHDLSRTCYPESSVDVREEPEYHSLESTSVVACRSAATEQQKKQEQQIPEEFGGRMMCAGTARAASML